MNVSDKRFKNSTKCRKNCFINVNEELGNTKVTFDTGASLKQILIRC